MLTNIKDVEDWLYDYTNLKQTDFKINKDTLVVDVLKDMYIKFQNNSIPIKFGKVYGDFEILVSSLNKELLKTKELSFEFLPEHINGDLNINDLPLEQKLFNNWNVKYVKGYINMCGVDAKLDNLNFLENTNFNYVSLKINNTPFKDDIIPEEIKKYNKGNPQKLYKKELMEIIISKDKLLDYFDFDNNFKLDKE